MRVSVRYWIPDENNVSSFVVALPQFVIKEHLAKFYPRSLLPLPFVLLHVSSLGSLLECLVIEGESKGHNEPQRDRHVFGDDCY